MGETILAYLAGVIDSDGFITIHRSTRKGRHYFGAVIGISGTRREPHDLAVEVWGGRVSSYTPANPRHRIQHQWTRTGFGAMPAIYDVLPYLRVKQQQAVLALECQELLLSRGTTDDPYPWALPDFDPLPRLEELRRQMVLELNQGRHIAPDRDFREEEGRSVPTEPTAQR